MSSKLKNIIFVPGMCYGVEVLYHQLEMIQILAPPDGQCTLEVSKL